MGRRVTCVTARNDHVEGDVIGESLVRRVQQQGQACPATALPGKSNLLSYKCPIDTAPSRWKRWTPENYREKQSITLSRNCSISFVDLWVSAWGKVGYLETETFYDHSNARRDQNLQLVNGDN